MVETWPTLLMHNIQTLLIPLSWVRACARGVEKQMQGLPPPNHTACTPRFLSAKEPEEKIVTVQNAPFSLWSQLFFLKIAIIIIAIRLDWPRFVRQVSYLKDRYVFWDNDLVLTKLPRTVYRVEYAQNLTWMRVHKSRNLPRIIVRWQLILPCLSKVKLKSTKNHKQNILLSGRGHCVLDAATIFYTSGLTCKLWGCLPYTLLFFLGMICVIKEK